MALDRTSPFARRRLLSEGPVELVAPDHPDPILVPTLAALARSAGDPAEVRAILDALPLALLPVLVDRMAGRQHLAPALAVALQLIPRARLSAMPGARLSRLYQLHRSAEPRAR